MTSKSSAYLKPENKPYRPYGGAREVLLCKDDAILIDGPAGTGKSIGLLTKGFIVAEKYAGARILLIRKTRKSMTESILVTWESKVVPTGHPCLRGASRKVRQSYEFTNGSNVVVGGMDSDHEAAVMSTDYDLILVFEGTELSESDIDKLFTRLRNYVVPYQQLIVDVNPSHSRHHLIQAVHAGKMKRIISVHQDNPLLYDHKSMDWTPQGRAYLAKLDKLSGHRRLRLRDGKWANAEGVVYDTFSDSLHIIEKSIPSHWRRIRSIDFGFTNPFVCQWWAIDEDGRIYRYRELYGTRRIVEDWAKKIMELSVGETIEATVSDHDAEDRATLERHGIETVPAHKAVQPGIQAVEARLRVAEDGRPRLFLVRDAIEERDPTLLEAKSPTCTDEELDCYVYPPGKNGKSKKEEPVKENDHGCDAMRYAVAYVDGLSAGNVDVVITGVDEESAVNDFDDEEGWDRLV